MIAALVTRLLGPLAPCYFCQKIVHHKTFWWWHLYRHTWRQDLRPLLAPVLGPLTPCDYCNQTEYRRLHWLHQAGHF